MWCLKKGTSTIFNLDTITAPRLATACTEKIFFGKWGAALTQERPVLKDSLSQTQQNPSVEKNSQSKLLTSLVDNIFLFESITPIKLLCQLKGGLN